ncbi:MAG: hypothetical protein IKG34_09290 [Solobacterium sp.]|nr:hypothetical protein [Solobacterium sp.]
MRKTLKQRTKNTGYRILTTTMIAGMTITSIAAPAMAAESMPITDEVYAVLFENKKPRDAIHDLMNRELKAENL